MSGRDLLLAGGSGVRGLRHAISAKSQDVFVAACFAAILPGNALYLGDDCLFVHLEPEFILPIEGTVGPSRDRIHAVKSTIALSFLIVCALLTAANAPTPATYIGHDTIAGVLAKGGVAHTASDLIIQGGHREKAGQVELHEKQTDIIYVQDGEATFVTGGKMIGGKPAKTGQYLGTEIQGGESHHLTKGDVVVVPAGTPHWFREVPKSISYFVVKVLK